MAATDFFEELRVVNLTVTDECLVPVVSNDDNSQKAASTAWVTAYAGGGSALLESDNTWTGENTFNDEVVINGTLAVFNNPVNIATATEGEPLLNIQCTTGPTNSGINLTNIGITQSGNVANYLRQVNITSNNGFSNIPQLGIKDGTSTAEFFVVPSSDAGFNPITSIGDTVIGAQHSNGSTTVLDLCVQSPQVNGLKIAPYNTYLYGGGFSTSAPASSLEAGNNTIKIYPSITFPDGSVQTTAATNSVSTVQAGVTYGITTYYFTGPSGNNYYYVQLEPQDSLQWFQFYSNTAGPTNPPSEFLLQAVPAEYATQSPSYYWNVEGILVPYTFAATGNYGAYPPYGETCIYSWPHTLPCLATFSFTNTTFQNNVLLPSAQTMYQNNAGNMIQWTFINVNADFDLFIYCQESQFLCFVNSSGATNRLQLAPGQSCVITVSNGSAPQWFSNPQGFYWAGVSFYSGPNPTSTGGGVIII